MSWQNKTKWILRNRWSFWVEWPYPQHLDKWFVDAEQQKCIPQSNDLGTNPSPKSKVSDDGWYRVAVVSYPFWPYPPFNKAWTESKGMKGYRLKNTVSPTLDFTFFIGRETECIWYYTVRQTERNTHKIPSFKQQVFAFPAAHWLCPWADIPNATNAAM